MIRRAFSAALAAAAILSAPAAAQSYPPQPAVGAPKPFTVPASESYRLPNGMQVTLIPYGLAPKATVSLRVYAGNLNEGDDVWLADLVGDMLKEGAGNRSAPQIAEAAAAMGGNLAVAVTRHETLLGLGVLSEHSADAIRLLSDLVQRPTLPASELERVKQNLARGLAVAKSQPQPVADAVLARAYYGPSHPYGRVFPTEAQLAGYTLDDVRGFYRDNFGARRARLYIAGQFDAAAVKAAIDHAFGGWRAGPERLVLPPQPVKGPQVLLVDRPGAPQSTIRIAYPAVPYGTDGDLRMRVTDALLGGSFTSRITRNIREDKGYTYSPYSSTTFNVGEAMWGFQADVTTADTGPALSEVFKEIRTLQATPPPADEARGISTWLSGVFVLSNASTGGLIGSLATRDFHGAPADWLDNYVPGVLAVTPADIQAVARERLPLSSVTMVVVGDLVTVKPQLEALPELKGIKMETAAPL